MIGFEVTGLLDMASALDAKAQQMLAAIPAALYQRGEAIMADSKEHYVPVKTGVLKNSGHVTMPEQQGNGWSIEIAYGGAASAYAWIQHETPHFNHPVGQWKYLETPLMNAVPGMAAAMASTLGGPWQV